MYGKLLDGHISLVYSWIEALFILTIPAFEGLHNDIFVVTRCIQHKLFKENKSSGERKQTSYIWSIEFAVNFYNNNMLFNLKQI